MNLFDEPRGDTSLYALIVGIDNYRAPVQRLHGAGNDVARVAGYLESRIAPSTALRLLTLRDEQATRQAVISGFRRHLGQARSGDTALFWFSGHGSLAPVPTAWAHREPTPMMQTMLCVDSRHDGVPDLLDKELAVLISEVAGRDVHVAVVLDCCHAEGGSRMPDALRARWEERLDTPPPVDALLAELRQQYDGDPLTRLRPADHVALAACQSDQAAYETAGPDGFCGVFSRALLNQLQLGGPDSTYRELMAGAGCRVENVVRNQSPVLYPIGTELVDLPFLGGELRSPAAAMRMRYLHDTWVIDAGACHGIVAGAGEDATRVAVHGRVPVVEAVVTRVLTNRSEVTPIDWEPVKELQYPIVLTRVPLPATPVSVGGEPGGDEATAQRVVAAIATAAAGGQPSAHLRVVRRGDAADLPRIQVAVPKPGLVRILSPDGIPFGARTAGVEDREAAARVVTELEHIARWQQVKELGNPLSGLAGAVRMEVLAATAAEWKPPPNRPPLPTGADGTVVLDYAWTRPTWTAPQVFVRLTNTTDRPLFCVLLNLTDRFRIHAQLFPGHTIAARHTAWATEGEPIVLTLPPGREVVPGASGRDWLKLLVAEERFSSEPFELPRLGEPDPPSESRGGYGISGVLDRLGLHATNRDAERRVPSALDWTTSDICVVTRVRDPRTS